jgi:hypothetical protein
MIAQQVIQRAITTHGNSLRTGVVFRDRRAAHFVICTNKVCGDRPVEGGLDPLPIAVIHKGRVLEDRLRGGRNCRWDGGCISANSCGCSRRRGARSGCSRGSGCVGGTARSDDHQFWNVSPFAAGEVDIRIARRAEGEIIDAIPMGTSTPRFSKSQQCVFSNLANHFPQCPRHD